ncbi:hypothetical protein FRC06_010293 [Ceratobasidium sp. 370]|nr:hypothetical protein FRC06_010293 [Ceratobasidium sp. 370]
MVPRQVSARCGRPQPSRSPASSSFPALNRLKICGYLAPTRDYLPPAHTLQAIIRAEKTAEEPHPAHGVPELTFTAPGGYTRPVLAIIGTDDVMTIEAIQKVPEDGDRVLLKGSQYNATGPNGKQTAPYYRTTIRREELVEDFDHTNPGIVKGFQGFVDAIRGVGNGRPSASYQPLRAPVL